MGGAFCCFRYITRSTWQSVKQVLWRASIMAITFTRKSGGLVGEILTLEWEEGTNSLSVSSRMLLSLAMFLVLTVSDLLFSLLASAERPSYFARNRSCTCGIGSFHCRSSTLVSLLLCNFFASWRSYFPVLVQPLSSFFVLLNTFCSTHSLKI